MPGHFHHHRTNCLLLLAERKVQCLQLRPNARKDHHREFKLIGDKKQQGISVCACLAQCILNGRTSPSVMSCLTGAGVSSVASGLSSWIILKSALRVKGLPKSRNSAFFLPVPYFAAVLILYSISAWIWTSRAKGIFCERGTVMLDEKRPHESPFATYNRGAGLGLHFIVSRQNPIQDLC